MTIRRVPAGIASGCPEKPAETEAAEGAEGVEGAEATPADGNKESAEGGKKEGDDKKPAEEKK